MSLYETLKAAKLGAAPDVYTTLRAQIAPFAKGGSTPTPTEKELEDTPPLSFNANGEPLLDWSMDGASGGVGNKTDNLFSSSIEQGTTIYGDLTSATNRVRSGIFYLGEGTFTFSCANSEDYQIGLDYHSSDGTYINGTGWLTSKTFDLNNSAPQIRLKIKKSNDANFTPQDIENVMVNEGSTAISYEPYGYKIPVTCGGETITIYLDAQLGASDSISMTDTGISIPTVNGSNTLSVGTTVQPSSVYIKYKE